MIIQAMDGLNQPYNSVAMFQRNEADIPNALAQPKPLRLYSHQKEGNGTKSHIKGKTVTKQGLLSGTASWLKSVLQEGSLGRKKNPNTKYRKLTIKSGILSTRLPIMVEKVL